MLIIRSFCVCFTIRFGSLVIGIANLIESSVVLILAAVWMGSDPSSTASTLKDYLAETKLIYVSDVLHRISKDPSPFRELALFLSCCRVLGCVGVIYGSFYMKPFYLLPFLGLEAVRLVFLIFLHITGMQIVKKNSPDLGLLITATLAGSFLLCFLLYTWLCVYSLYKVLRKISRAIVKPNSGRLIRELSPSSPDESPPRLYPAYYSNYTSPIAPIY